MFSSPSRGTPRRKVGGGPSSVRSTTPHGRASTPTLGRHANRRREDSILSTDVTMEGNTRDQWSDKRREKAKSEALEGSVFSRDELHAVTVYCRMPIDVINALQRQGQYDPCISYMDPQTGHAYLTTQDRCFVWSFASRGAESSPCYIFPLTISSNSISSIVSPSLPFCSLLSRGGDREPGLIILTPSGELRFCDNIASSLGGERMVRKSIPLGSGEIVTQLHRCGTSLFLASTSQSRLFSIRFIVSGGSLQAQISPFTQSKGLFGRLFGTAPQLGSSTGIISIASGQSSDSSGAFEVYTMGTSLLQKWSIVEGGAERLLIEEDLKQLLMNLIKVSFVSDSFALVDVALTGASTAGVLYCYATTADGPLRYQVAFIESNNYTPSFNIVSTSSLDYSRFADARPYSNPHLLLPYGGPVFYVIFPEAVVMRLVESSNFEETIEMRDVATNRIIGFGAEGPDVEGPAGISNLSIITPINGALLIEIDIQQAQDLDQFLEFGSDKIQVLTRRLKSKVERGVFHNNESHNPISFDLPQEIGGNLMTAVQQLSQEIVESQSSGLSKSVDLRVQLADRLEKLHGLICLIAANGKFSLLSQNVLRQLCSDAEVVAAAIDIWDYYSTSVSASLRQEGAATDPLAAAIRATLEAIPNLGWQGDVVRFFFRHHLSHLNDVLARLSNPLELLESSSSAERSRASLIKVNHIVLSTFQAAYRYRAETANLYHLDFAHISFEAWTCKMSNIKLLQRQFQSTYELLQGGKGLVNEPLEEGVTMEEQADEISLQQQMIKGQLCDLAKSTLDLFEERLSYLRVFGGANPFLEKETHFLEEEFRLARSQIILSLVDIGRSDRAFYLAEKHTDFQVLTLLCSSLKGNAQAIRIRSYLEKYQSAFAFELYEHYIQSGAISKLLEEEEDYHNLLSEFLRSRQEYNRIAWLHDLNLKQWNQASKRLHEEANNETKRVQDKKLMLSLQKLSHVAQLNEGDVASIVEQERIELIDDQLDIVNVHQKLREELQGNTAERQRDDFEHKLEASTEILGEASPAFKNLYCIFATQLVKGAVLSSEDLLDILTLPDASELSIEHFKTAIEVFVRVKASIPPARQMEALASLWRRVILHDDWLEVTDATLASTSDEILVAKMKSTAYYQILQNALENKSTSEIVLSPSDCLKSYSFESLQARFKLEDSVLVNALKEDYELELQRASQIIDLGIARGWFDDVTRLIKQEQEEAEQTQDAMDEADSPYVTMY